MEGIFSTEVVLAIITAVSGGVAYLAKYILNKRDEAQKRLFEQRDKDKAEIKGNITNLQNDMKTVKKHLHNVSAMVMKCDNPDCPTKKKLAEYFEKEDF